MKTKTGIVIVWIGMYAIVAVPASIMRLWGFLIIFTVLAVVFAFVGKKRNSN